MKSNVNLNECIPTMSAMLNMLVALFYRLTECIKPLWRGKKNIQTKQNAGGTMTKMTDEKEGWLFLTGCG